MSKNIISLLSKSSTSVKDSLTLEKSINIILDENHVEWYQFNEVKFINNKIRFSSTISPLPTNIDRNIIENIRNMKKTCIYDNGDNGFYSKNGTLSYHLFLYDEDVDHNEINNFTIWLCYNDDNHFFILVTGRCGRTCSIHSYEQFHNCKIYVSNDILTLVNYGMTDSQRKKCEGIVWITDPKDNI